MNENKVFQPKRVKRLTEKERRRLVEEGLRSAEQARSVLERMVPTAADWAQRVR